MSNNESFKLSQDYELIPPKKQKAYPILIEEWNYIKEKISNIKENINFFHTVGAILLGISGSAFITVITLDFPITAKESFNIKYLGCWSIFGITLLGGLLSIYFSKKEKDNHQNSKSDVIKQMEVIEGRFEISVEDK